MIANWKTMFGLQNAPFGSHYCAKSSNPPLLSHELIDLVWRFSPISLFVEPCAILLVQYHACNTINAFTVSPIAISAENTRQREKKSSSDLASFALFSSADDGVDCASNSGWSETRAPSGRNGQVIVGMRGIVGENPDASVIISHAVGRANA
ncbi:uncharacterized protein TrAtP1_005626 [Trichoderma atroviride]|uniref:uncharacterized protein n=1 Tax=Hypocrea atroviridis TaxID=63577 RepID=UPI003327B369|nr:hypothetical protein TrAtP1_005626 [Trichoderma atroviride]